MLDDRQGTSAWQDRRLRLQTSLCALNACRPTRSSGSRVSVLQTSLCAPLDCGCRHWYSSHCTLQVTRGVCIHQDLGSRCSRPGLVFLPLHSAGQIKSLRLGVSVLQTSLCAPPCTHMSTCLFNNRLQAHLRKQWWRWQKKKKEKRAAGIHDENILDVVYEIVVDFCVC